MNPWDAVKDAIVDSIKAKAKDFLDSHEDAKEFVKERAERLAKLAYKYSQNKDNLIKEQMEIVKQSIENELASVAVNASVEAKALFSNILSTVFEAAVKIMPAVISSL